MEKRMRMWFKACLIIAGLFFFCFLAGRRAPDVDYEKEARLRQYEEDEEIEKTDLTLLACGESFPGESGSVLTTEGVYTYETEEVEASLYRQVRAYIRDGVIIEIAADEAQKETRLANLWLSGVEENRILCFYKGDSFYLPWQTEQENREQVADIILKDGEIKECRIKKEKITGKLLGVDDGRLWLPGKELTFAEDMKVYRLYGTLEEISPKELPVGYENTDYVIENGEVCACLVTREEAMETIRVLLQGGNYEGIYHKEVSLSADCDYELKYGEETERFEAGEEFTVSEDDERFEKDGRILMTASVNTGRWKISSIIRNRETADYRGSIEIMKMDEGLVVINELLLEEYLYGVVPSEMPASYPAESLKAQAVCARTYAYRNMKTAGLPQFGAHVDDSTAFQVYGNTQERPETTEAVKATKGEILMYGQEPVNAYYYSTSCGYGTDISAWNGEGAKTLPYLQAKSISKAEAEKETGTAETEKEEAETGAETEKAEIGAEAETGAEAMRSEETFGAFIKGTQPDDFERDEAWYRWQYRVEQIDVGEMEERLLQRYAAQPQFILTQNGEGGYISQRPGRIGILREVRIVSRNPGGGAAELLLTGSEGTYLVQTEYNIRYLLANGKHYAQRQDGTEADVPTLLPSAFFLLETSKEEETVVGYTIIGGGYGHGIGMSQNGARNMALSGMNAEEILTFFYENSAVEAVY